MNYLELELGGKKRGLKLGLLFLETAQKNENKNIQELFEELLNRTVFFAPKLIYIAMLTNCEIKGVKPDFTLEDVYDWIEEVGLSKDENPINQFMVAFEANIQRLFNSEKILEDEGKNMPLKKKVSTVSGGSKK